MPKVASTMDTRPLGSTGFEVTAVCIGCSPLGMPGMYGSDTGFDDAVRCVHAMLDGPFNFIDTSNGYGDSERQIGRALQERDGIPDGVLLATKVDPAPSSADFSGDRVRASVAESLDRLGVDHLDLVHLHDPERISFEEAMGAGGAVEALVALRDEGLIGSLGVAGLDGALLQRFVETGAFEVVLSHNQFTLIDQSAADLFEVAVARGVAVLNAAPYGGGMLAKGPDVVPMYCYGIDNDNLRQRAREMLAVCERHGVPLAAAALQFSLRDERITSTVIGITKPERLAETERLATLAVPEQLWEDLAPFVAGSIREDLGLG